MDMRNNKRRNVLTHVRVNLSQSETSSLAREGGELNFELPLGGGGGLTEKIPHLVCSRVQCVPWGERGLWWEPCLRTSVECHSYCMLWRSVAVQNSTAQHCTTSWIWIEKMTSPKHIFLPEHSNLIIFFGENENWSFRIFSVNHPLPSSTNLSPPTPWWICEIISGVMF